MTETKRRYEDAVRAQQEEAQADAARFRAWLRDRKITPTKEDEIAALRLSYELEHEADTARLIRLAGETAALRAELDRRWIEAHEDLAILRQAGEGVRRLRERMNQ